MDPLPIVKVWDWMSPEEQTRHLIDTHGYDEDWFDEDSGPWDRERVERHFDSDGGTRHDYHSGDHHDTEGGGGSVLHEHSLVHQAEVDQAIASIERTVRSRV